MSRLHNVLAAVERGTVYAVWLVLICLTLLVTADVLLRYAFKAPLPASVNMTELFMPYIVFLPLAYALSQEQHVRVSLALERLPASARRYAAIVSNLIALVLCVLLVYQSGRFFWESFIIRERMLAPIYLPWWVGKLAMPVGFALMAVRYACQLLEQFTDANPDVRGW